MKTRIKKFIVFMLLQVACSFVFVGCGSPTVVDSLKRYSIDAQLLNKYEIVCDIKGETFTGRAPCYGVLLFENEPTAFLQSLSTDKSDGFSSEKNVSLENAIDIGLEAQSWKIPSEYYPNWNSEYIWLFIGEMGGLDTLYMIYFPNLFNLIIFETGH